MMNTFARTLILCWCFLVVVSLPLYLAPYGSDFGDINFMQRYDRSETVNLAVPFFFETTPYAVAYINENGFITFGQRFENLALTPYPRHFPIPSPNNIPIVAAYWADVDITKKGNIYYRVEIDQGPGSDVAQATVRNYFNNGYKSSATLIATWVNVTYDGGSTISPVGADAGFTDTQRCIEIPESGVDITMLGLPNHTTLSKRADRENPPNGLYAVTMHKVNSPTSLSGLFSTSRKTCSISGASHIHPFDDPDYMYSPQTSDTWRLATAPADFVACECPDVFYWTISYMNRPIDSEWFGQISSVNHVKVTMDSSEGKNTTILHAYYSETGNYLEVWNFEKNGNPTRLYYSGSLSGAVDFVGKTNVLQLGMINSKIYVIARPSNTSVILTYCAEPYEFDNFSSSVIDCDESRYFFKLEISYSTAQYMEFSVTVNAIYMNSLCGDCGNFDGVLNQFESANASDGYFCNDGVHATCNTIWPNTSPTMYSTKLQCLLDCWTNVDQHFDEMLNGKQSSMYSTTACQKIPCSGKLVFNTDEGGLRLFDYTSIKKTANAVQKIKSRGKAQVQQLNEELNDTVPCANTWVKNACYQLINETGLFAPCIEAFPQKMSSLHETCVFDMCAVNSSEAQICTFFATAAKQCRWESNKLEMFEWRTEVLCPMSCPAGMHYSPCKAPCIPTCQNPSALANCAGACVEGCFCDDNLVFKDGFCITHEECGCRDQYNYYRQYNETWLADNGNSVCMCNSETKNATCRALPACQPHATRQRVQNSDVPECVCDVGFEAVANECLRNPCSVKPCTHGSCISQHDGTNYMCTCQYGWNGDMCDKISDYCATVKCLNNGTCENVTNGFKCHCQPGFSGTYCDSFENNRCVQSDSHQPIDCGNGVCINEQDGYQCKCTAGYYGDHCEDRTDFCLNNKCDNDRVCRNGYYNATCECAEGCIGVQCIELECLQSTDMTVVFNCMSKLLACDQLEDPFNYALQMLGDVLASNYNRKNSYDPDFKQFLLRYGNCTYDALKSKFQQPALFPCCTSVSTEMPLIMAGCMQQEGFEEQSGANYHDFDKYYLLRSCTVSKEILTFDTCQLDCCMHDDHDCTDCCFSENHDCKGYADFFTCMQDQLQPCS